MSIFRVPDLGEGLTEATVVTWHVAVGDEVALNQVLAEVETAKATVELPSPRAGRITALRAEEGETLDVGAPLVEFAEIAADGEAPAGPADGIGAADGESAADVARSADAPAPEGTRGPRRQQVLVGYGPKLPTTGRPRRRPRVFETVAFVGRSAEAAARERPAAMPPVRRHARDLGVDLETVHGSGPGGRILREDVDACAKGGTATCPAPGTTRSPSACSDTVRPDTALAGSAAKAASPAEATTAQPPSAAPAAHRIPVMGLRRATAAAMTASTTAPQAAVFHTVDVTPTLKRLRRAEQEGRRTSFLAAVCRAVLPAVDRTPLANARFDAGTGEIEQFDDVALGIAVATDRGLVVVRVPTGTDEDAPAHTGHLAGGPALTARIARAAARAREGSATPAELTGSTLTLTNVGVFGVEGGVPLLNPGQSVILAIGAVRTQPWEHRGRIRLREVVTLTVSFDHRVLDGAEASAFLRDVADVLGDPGLLLTR